MEHVGTAYRATDKVNIPDLQKKLQRRIDMVCRDCEEVGGSGRFGFDRPAVTLPHHERIRSHCSPIRSGTRQWQKG